MNWDPAKHPRKPKGSPEGGQFAALEAVIGAAQGVSGTVGIEGRDAVVRTVRGQEVMRRTMWSDAEFQAAKDFVFRGKDPVRLPIPKQTKTGGNYGVPKALLSRGPLVRDTSSKLAAFQKTTMAPLQRKMSAIKLNRKERAKLK